MSHRDFYPRWITLPTGQQMIVQTHQQHSALLGQEFDECARPVNRRPEPPTIEEVLASGYPPEVAEHIFQVEQRKAEQGIQPYGDKPESEYVPATPEPSPEPVEPEAPAPPVEEEAFPEPFYPPVVDEQPVAAAEQAAAEAADPLGIFEPGESAEDEVAPDPAAAPDKPAKRRGKSKE